MAKVFIEETTLSAIGDAIREKTGKTELIDPANMGTEIASIEVGGGGEDLPEDILIFTGNCDHVFRNAWDDFINHFKSRITTKDISSFNEALHGSTITEIPFVINIKNAGTISRAFTNMYNLMECPKIRGTLSTSSRITASSIIDNCYRVRDFSDLFEPSIFDYYKDFKVSSSYLAGYPVKFNCCYSMRAIPEWWYLQKLRSEDSIIPTSGSSCLYNTCFNNCHALDEILDMPVWTNNGTATANMFANAFTGTSRTKAITFETNNGQPIAANWKNQNIDLGSGYIGFCDGEKKPIKYNSGITADKEVKDDATYQALKNDPDWFTMNSNYSRYNHDSAVETINSLPDTKAYLATAGGTNTIKFKGQSGEKTDGGAINTLTDAEKMVAADKGWTVAIV